MFDFNNKKQEIERLNNVIASLKEEIERLKNDIPSQLDDKQNVISKLTKEYQRSVTILKSIENKLRMENLLTADGEVLYSIKILIENYKARTGLQAKNDESSKLYNSKRDNDEEISKALQKSNTTLKAIESKLRMENLLTADGEVLYSIKILIENYKAREDIFNKYENERNTQKELNKIVNNYASAYEKYNQLLDEIKIYEDNLEDYNLGLNKPIFNLDTPENLKKKVLEIRKKQKDLIKEGKAVICETEWRVDDSIVEGRQMTKRNINLITRAFNGEVDSLIAKVRWNNYDKLFMRIYKIHEQLKRLGEKIKISISENFLNLKIEELTAYHQYLEKKQIEKEKLREKLREEREEIRAQKEIEEAIKESEEKEKYYQEALDKAKQQLGLINKSEISQLSLQIKELEAKLKESQLSKERAISRAQITKSGHVYIISNIGSFGEGIYKIGMTRRLDPYDRVKELGDASVPYKFDTYAMIYTDDAPELEKMIHNKFEEKRVNLVNNRKEFFKVSLEEIEQFLNDNFSKQYDIIRAKEAREYRETRAILEAKRNERFNQHENKFKSNPFE